LGGANRLTCRVSNGQLFVGDALLGSLAAADDAAADLYVRAHDVELLPTAPGTGLQGELLRLTWGGGMTHAQVRLQSGTTVEVDVPPWSSQGHSWGVGQAVSVRLRRYGVFGTQAGAHPAASVGL
jgi:ABC-type sulfate/molybdate transport systems ATPase subunit